MAHQSSWRDASEVSPAQVKQQLNKGMLSSLALSPSQNTHIYGVEIQPPFQGNSDAQLSVNPSFLKTQVSGLLTPAFGTLTLC